MDESAVLCIETSVYIQKSSISTMTKINNTLIGMALKIMTSNITIQKDENLHGLVHSHKETIDGYILY